MTVAADCISIPIGKRKFLGKVANALVYPELIICCSAMAFWGKFYFTKLQH